MLASLRAAVLVAAASAAAFLIFAAAYFNGLRSSDGANYAVVARNLAEGRGLTSSVIQPGLVGVVPTSAEGQASVIQAPLWPVVVAGAFRLFGASEAVFLALNGALFVLVLSQTWRLGHVMTGSTGWAWLAWAFAALNPFLIGSAIAGTAAMLQAALVNATLLAAAVGRASPGGAALVGALLGLALVTRESSIFLAPAIALVWLFRLRQGDAVREARPRAVALRLLSLAAVLLAVAAVPVALEAVRKASLIGRFDAPVLRLTFLYYTSVADQGWYFIYDHPMLRIDPVAYFLEHPGELFAKMWFQLRVSFAKETLPALMCFVPWFVPVAIPGRMGPGLPRAIGASLLAALGLQVLLGSTSFLNFTYFFAFLPALSACVAATLLGLRRELVALETRGRRRLLLAVLAAYAALPPVVNAAWLAAGRRPGTGDYELSRADERALSQFVRAHTPDGAVLSASHAALLAWNTRRTVFQYSGHPRYTVGDTPMWRALDEKVRIDYVLLNSLALETPERGLLPGFRETARLRSGELRAWLYTRGDAPSSRAPKPPATP